MQVGETRKLLQEQRERFQDDMSMEQRHFSAYMESLDGDLARLALFDRIEDVDAAVRGRATGRQNRYIIYIYIYLFIMRRSSSLQGVTV